MQAAQASTKVKERDRRTTRPVVQKPSVAVPKSMIFAQASSDDLGGDLSFSCTHGQRRRKKLRLEVLRTHQDIMALQIAMQDGWLAGVEVLQTLGNICRLRREKRVSENTSSHAAYHSGSQVPGEVLWRVLNITCDTAAG
jgi:hypothetical protein